MRVDDTRSNVEQTAASLSRLMDDFAALSTHAGAPAIGGYRVVHTSRPSPRPAPRPRHAPMPRPRRARTPMRMTGTLAALIVSSIGVAAFSGPATCPCSRPDTAAALETPDANSLSRFAYARPAVANRAYRVVPLGEADLSSVEAHPSRGPETIELADAREPADESPISTAAIEPATSYDGQPAIVLANTRGGLLPARTVLLSDAAPKPIRLAAATPDEVSPPSIPEIAVKTLPVSEFTIGGGSDVATQSDTPSDAETNVAVATPSDVETSDEPTAQSHPSRRHTASKHRPYRAYRSVGETRERKGKRLANIPPWAEKMFVPVWQTRAFNY